MRTTANQQVFCNCSPFLLHPPSLVQARCCSPILQLLLASAKQTLCNYCSPFSPRLTITPNLPSGLLCKCLVRCLQCYTF
jgi:hypothetical protein